ncbi:DUF7523 family protein [Natronomonas sp.]|uniref:DUF7523 family protein n=1 Tax=Natronomonas sp. TaxID=2184060 RepID=UPI002621A814|nr:hypothetical protein [Natronomonas sp.]
MTIAADARAAVRACPFVYDGLRAGVLNYTAAARFLDVGDAEAVGAALRRYAEELDDFSGDDAKGRASVSMRSGVAKSEDGTGLLSVGGVSFAVGGGEHTAIVATGSFGAEALEAALGRLRTAGVGVVAAAGTEGSVTVVVGRREGPDAVRAVEDAL